jgi:undecaprenyl-diphosphatase
MPASPARAPLRRETAPERPPSAADRALREPGRAPHRPGRPVEGAKAGHDGRGVTRDGRRLTGARHDAGARFGARTLLALLAVGLVAVPFGVLLVLVRSRWGPLWSLDMAAARDLHALALASDAFVTAMKALSAIGSAAVYLPFFAVLAGVLVWRELPRLALFAVVTVLGSSALNALVKAAVDRARPALPDPVASAPGLSFPSGHAQAAIVCYSLLLVVLAPMLGRRALRVAGAAAALMVVAIGFSRVALGVHYVSDVLGGYVLGAAWVAAMTAVFTAWRRDRGPGADPYGSATAPRAGRPGPAPRLTARG